MRHLTYLLFLSLLAIWKSGPIKPGKTDKTETIENKNEVPTLIQNATKDKSDSAAYIFHHDMHMQQSIDKLLTTFRRGITHDNTAISIYDISTGTYIYNHNDQMLMAPASCMKLLTAITAIDRLGENYEFCDSLFMNGTIDENGTLNGSLILKMDDNPLFMDFNQWAKAVKEKGIKRIEGNIIMNLARRDTLRPHPTDKPWDIKYFKLPLLLKGEKFIKRNFIQTLANKGIKVKEEQFTLKDPNLNEYWTKVAQEHFGDPSFDLNHMMRRIALDQLTNNAECIISSQTPLIKVLAPMLIYSSNIKAESIFYHLDNVYGGLWQSHSQYGKSPHEVEKFLMEEMGIDTKSEGFVINDGSGLSPENRLTSDFLVQLLLWAYNKEDIRDILISEGLASPGLINRTGSLKKRMSYGYTKGRIFCKTGTIVTTGTSSLAGYAHGINGHWYAFAIIQKDTPVWNARDFQDRVCREMVK
ncbi:MAG: D-alanyl-D-alanine carboxypeptidase [Bacteroidaceae bacterium]|nr:D-alanyl-D-alanine carboxypeptidase [Bacteroidaceae bacterium]